MGVGGSAPSIHGSLRALQFDMVRVAEVVYIFKANQFSFVGDIDVVAALLEGDTRLATTVIDHFASKGRSTVNILSFLAGLVLVARDEASSSPRGGKASRSAALVARRIKAKAHLLYDTFDLEHTSAMSTADLTVLFLSSLRALVVMLGKGRHPADEECERLALLAYAKLGKSADSVLTRRDFYRYISEHVLAPVNDCCKALTSLEHVMHAFGILSQADLPPPPPPSRQGMSLLQPPHKDETSASADPRSARQRQITEGSKTITPASTAMPATVEASAPHAPVYVPTPASSQCWCSPALHASCLESSKLREDPAGPDNSCIGVAFHTSGRYCLCEFSEDATGRVQIRAVDPETNVTYRGSCSAIDMAAIAGNTQGRERILRLARLLKLLNNVIVVNVNEQSRCSTPAEDGRIYLSTVQVAFQTGHHCLCSIWIQPSGGLWISGLDPISSKTYEGTFTERDISRISSVPSIKGIPRSVACDFVRSLVPHLLVAGDSAKLTIEAAYKGTASFDPNDLGPGARHIATLGVTFQAGRSICSFWAVPVGNEEARRQRPLRSSEFTLRIRAFEYDMARYFDLVFDDAEFLMMTLSPNRGFADVLAYSDIGRQFASALASHLVFSADGRSVALDRTRRWAVPDDDDYERLKRRQYLSTIGIVFPSRRCCVCSFWKTSFELYVRGYDAVNDCLYDGTFTACEFAQLGCSSLENIPIESKARDFCIYIVPHIKFQDNGLAFDVHHRETTLALSSPQLGEARRAHVATIGVYFEPGRYCVASFFGTEEGGLRVRGFDPDTRRKYSGVFAANEWYGLGLGKYDPSMCGDKAQDLCRAIAGYMRPVHNHDAGQRSGPVCELKLDIPQIGAKVDMVETHAYHVMTIGLTLRSTKRYLVCSFWAISNGSIRIHGYDSTSNGRVYLGEIEEIDGGPRGRAETRRGVHHLPRKEAEAACMTVACHLQLNCDDSIGTGLTVDVNSRSNWLESAIKRPRHLSTIGIWLQASRCYCICTFWQITGGVLLSGVDVDTEKVHGGYIEAEQWMTLGLGDLSTIPVTKAHDFCLYLAPHLTLRSNQLVFSAACRSSIPGARLGHPSAKVVQHLAPSSPCVLTVTKIGTLITPAHATGQCTSSLGAACSAAPGDFAPDQFSDSRQHDLCPASASYTYSPAPPLDKPLQEAPVPDMACYRRQVAGGVAEAKPPACVR